MGALWASPAHAAARPTGTLRCGSSTLVLSWRGTTGGLAGSGGDLFWVRNIGPATCVLVGFPSVNFESGARRAGIRARDVLGPFGNDVFGVRAGSSPPRVRLAPRGGLASFAVFGEDVSGACPTLTRIDISIAGTVGRVRLVAAPEFSSWPYCGTQVIVNPLVPGASGSLPARSLRDEIEYSPG